ncbi:MAG: EpsG family protein [Cycloclasticus sp.]|jgi:hypothetical protein
MIYFVLLLILFFGSVKYDLFQEYPRKSSSITYLKFSYILLWGVAAFRFRLGPDSIAYEYFYDNEMREFYSITLDHLIDSRFGIVWVLLSGLFKSFSGYYVYQAFIALFSIFSVYAFVRRYSQYPHITSLLFYLFLYHYFSMEILREACAISFFLWSLSYLDRNKVFSGLLYILCVLTHWYSVVLIPIYIILIFNVSHRKVLISCFLFLLPLILIDNPVDKIETFLNVFRSVDLTYYKVLPNLSFFGYIYYFMKLGFTLILIAYSRKIKSSWGVFESRMFVVVTIFYCTFIVIRIFGIPHFERFLNYFVIFVMILGSQYVMTLLGRFSYGLKLLVFSVALPIIVIFSMSPILKVDETKKFQTYSTFYPYYSIFNPNYDESRENYSFEGW